MMRRSARWLLLVLLVPIAPVGAAPSKPGSIPATLQPFVDSHALAGAVTLVGTPEKVLSLDAVGWADMAARKPMQADCLFWIASQSKPITAAAVMILVDEGKLALDDPVEKHLPEFRGQWLIAERDADHLLLKKPPRPITIRNVLSHTSGLPFKSAIEDPTLDLFPLATRVRSYSMLPLDFAPLAKSQYSNAGVNTAGRIVEVVTGLPFEEFLAKQLLEPLGMKDTSFWPNADQLARLAKAYKPKAGGGLEETPIAQLKYPLNDRQRQPMPAGGLFSTATDLWLFYRMIANGGMAAGKRLLSEDAVRELTSKQTGDLPTPYGLCFSTGGDRVGHGGAYGTNSSYDLKRRLITVFLVQHAGWTAEGKKILPAFQKAAAEIFGPTPK